MEAFLAWLAGQGDIVHKRIQGTDVSRTLFDQAIALENLQLTLDRMRKLLDKEGLLMKDILDIEREMTRLRGDRCRNGLNKSRRRSSRVGTGAPTWSWCDW